MEELELDSVPKNKFYEIINPHYGKLFQEVYDSDISSRDEKMQKLYEESKEDKLINAHDKVRFWIVLIFTILVSGAVFLPSKEFILKMYGM